VDPVPLLDLKAQFVPLREEINRAVNEIVEAQAFILGQPVQLLEEEVARFVGSTQAVGCASGTDALILALAALGVGPGDEVLTSPFSFFSSASCAYKVGARPAFADIDPRTFNLDPEKVDAAIGPRTRALLPVHLFGQCADMDAFREIGSRRNLPVVEDAAQALSATYRSAAGGAARHAGAVGEAGCYSFFPSKNLGGFGDGGMVVTSDADLAERLRLLRVHGGQQMYHHRWVGWNSRLDALQAAVLRVKLPHVDGWIEERRANADRYRRLFAEAGLEGTVGLPQAVAGRGHTFNQYVVRVPKRDALRAFLAERGIGVAVYYPLPLHLQPCFTYLGYHQGDFPVSEHASREVLALPVFPELTQDEQHEVVNAIAEFYSA